MLRINDEAFADIVESLIDNRYCPNGKQINGCPIDATGQVLPCEICWERWFSDFCERV